jgi:hypothetical protein
MSAGAGTAGGGWTLAATRTLELSVTATGSRRYRVEAHAKTQGSAFTEVKVEGVPSPPLASLVERPTSGEELRQIGLDLFSILFAGDVGRLFERSLGEVLAGEELALRLVLRIDPPELAVVPWELLFTTERDLFLASSPRTTITRTLPLMLPIGSIAAPAALRALFVVPQSAGLTTAAEDAGLERLAAALGRGGTVDRPRGKITPEALRQALRQGEVDLVHFAGHGSFGEDGPAVYLDGKAGLPLRVPSAVFGELFRDRPSIRLVVLNACEGARRSVEGLGGLVPRLLQCGVPAVLAMQSRITDSEAAIFASTFYAELVQGSRRGNVEAALARARAALFQERFPSPIFASPVLYMRSEDGALWRPGEVDREAVAAAAERNAGRVRKGLEPAILPRISRLATRAKLLPAIRESLLQRRSRIIPVVGAAGFGKSTLLGEIYDGLEAAKPSWLALVSCDELALSDPGDLPAALSRAICGSEVPFPELAQRLGSRGAGVLLLDTLDLILTPALVPHLQRLLHDLEPSATTTVFTCRDHDYQLLLEPPRLRLRQVAERVDRYELPRFEPGEVARAATSFVEASPRLRGTAAGGAFAERILALVADRRPIQDVARHPLLLAMLCDLFGEAGDVPGDLTVSELYDRYWEEKVLRSRVYGPSSPVLVAKRQLCMRIAQHLVELSREHLRESVAEADLDLAVTSAVAGARAELLSEGVLRLQAGDQLRFFHQTLLEYTMARWLATRAGEPERERLLAGLAVPGEGDLPLFWWPVIRQLLLQVDDATFDAVARRLPQESLAAFRTLVFAAAGRGDGRWMAELARSSLGFGSEHQRSVCASVDGAPARFLDKAWMAVETILRSGARDAAHHAVFVAGRLLGRPEAAVAVRCRELLGLVEERMRAGESQEGDVELLGQVVRACLPAIETAPEPAALDLLRERYFDLGHGSRAAVLELFGGAGVPPRSREAMIETVMSRPPGKSLGREQVELIAQVLRARRAAGLDWGEILHGEVPPAWESMQGRALGRLAREEGALLDCALADLVHPGSQWLRRSVNLLREAIRDGQGGAVATKLLRVDLSGLPGPRRSVMAALVADLAGTADPGSRLALALWLEPAARERLEDVASGFGAVADAAVDTWETLVLGLRHYAERGRSEVVGRILKAVALACRSRLVPELEGIADRLPHDGSLQVTMVAVHASVLATSETARARVLELALSRRKEVALAAASALRERAEVGEPPPAAELLAMAASSFAGVRDHLLQALSALQEHGVALDDAGLVRLCASMSAEPNSSTLQALCTFVGTWVRSARRAPAEVAGWLAQVTTLLGDRLDGGLARALIRTLKVVAQIEDRGLLGSLEEPARTLLKAIDLNRLSDGESEMIDLLSAVARLTPDFLPQTVAVASGLPPRNVRALALAIRRAEGADSPLLSELLGSPWCPPPTRSLILKLRGA